MAGDLFNNFTKPLIQESARLRGGIKRVLALPCETPVAIYVETLVPAVLGAFTTIIEPDPKEVYHKVSGKSLICDVSVAGKELARIGGVEDNPVTRFLFKGLGLYDAATWYFFLGDVVVEGLVNWTSAIYAQRECQNKNNPNYGSGALYHASLHGDGEYGGADFEYDAPSYFSPVSPTHLILGPSRTGTIAASLQFELDHNVPVSTTCQITYLGTGIIFDQDSNDAGGGVGSRPNHAWAKQSNPFDEVMQMQCWWSWQGQPKVQVFGDAQSAHCTMVLS